MRRQLILTVAAALFSGCAGEGSEPLTTMVDSAGVTLVLNTGDDRPVSSTAQLSYRLGGAPTGPESFYQVYPWQVSIAPNGVIAVLNRGASQVSTFSADGAHLSSFGQPGEGPGEFRFPSSLAVTSSGDVLVYDYAKRALVGFDSSGVILEEQHLTVPFTGVRMASAGVGLVLLSERRPRGDGTGSRRILRLTSADTVELGPGVESAFKGVRYESCGMSMSQPPLFAFDLAWGSSGHRTVMAPGPGYSIWMFEDTTLVRIVRRDMEPELATTEVALRELGVGEHWGIGGRDCLVPAREIVEARGFGTAVPIIENVAVTYTGELWVQRRSPGTPARAIDMFDADGRYVGTRSPDFPFPIGFLPDGRAVTIETDSLDVQTVAVYEMR